MAKRNEPKDMPTAPTTLEPNALGDLPSPIEGLEGSIPPPAEPAPARRAAPEPHIATEGVVTVELVTVDVPEDKPDDREWYYIGATDACPSGCVHIAGMDFPKFSDPPRELSEGGDQFRHRMRGKLVRLTPKQVEKIKRDVVDQYFQFDGTKVNKKTRKNVYYKPSIHDRSAAYFVFMQKVLNPRLVNRDIMSDTPQPMARPRNNDLFPAGFDPKLRLHLPQARPILAMPEALRPPDPARK